MAFEENKVTTASASVSYVLGFQTSEYSFSTLFANNPFLNLFESLEFVFMPFEKFDPSVEDQHEMTHLVAHGCD